MELGFPSTHISFINSSALFHDLRSSYLTSVSFYQRYFKGKLLFEEKARNYMDV
jgi:hypothetical protein